MSAPEKDELAAEIAAGGGPVPPTRGTPGASAGRCSTSPCPRT